MTRKAKAVVYRELGKPVCVETVEILPPGPDEVTVKVAACGVCHSDLSVTNGTIPLPPGTVLGHEGAGTIVEVGSAVTDLQVGDTVAISWIPMCGTCRFCLMGRSWLCDKPLKHGPRMPDGGSRIRDEKGNELNHFMSTAVMAEYATLHKSSIIKIDKTVSLECAALVGCAVSTGVGAVLNTAKVEPGSSVVVIGAGGVGLNAIQGASLSGARIVVAVDMADGKLEYAKAFGATDVVNPTRDGDAVDKVRKITGGADYVFECIGLPETIRQAYFMLRKGGMAVVVGIAPMTSTVELPAIHLAVTEKILTGSMYGSTRPRVDFPKFIQLYKAKRLKIEELITKRYEIENAQLAFDEMKTNARGVIVFS